MIINIDTITIVHINPIKTFLLFNIFLPFLNIKQLGTKLKLYLPPTLKIHIITFSNYLVFKFKLNVV